MKQKVNFPLAIILIILLGAALLVFAFNYDFSFWKGKDNQEQKEIIYSNKGFSYQMNDSYLYTKEALKENGWIPILPNNDGSPIIKELPEISHCGTGVDAICSVDFKKTEGNIEYRNHLNIQEKNSIWIVVGSE